MHFLKRTRRGFLMTSAGAVLAGAAGVPDDQPRPRSRPKLPPFLLQLTPEDVAKQKAKKSGDFRIGVIGVRHQGAVVSFNALPHGDIVAVCDAHREIRETARKVFNSKADVYEDYRKLLERQDIDAVIIGAPDHWHTAMAIAACQAGKDVYSEKPLTLTIDEGKMLTKVVRETGRVFQVGTWQRSDEGFRLACELVRQGRIGKLKKVTVTLGKNKKGGPFKNTTPPGALNWDLWQGQTPNVPYCKERSFSTFRWWYEYSGGQMTDWGAHHIDIAHWGMDMDHSGPVEIDGQAEFPHIENGYNVATSFQAKMVYPDGVEMFVTDTGLRGVNFEGSQGNVFVNRGALEGSAVEDLKNNPLPREDYTLYAHGDPSLAPEASTAFFERGGNYTPIKNHVANFFDCIKTRNMPISDVFSQHRSVSACHLANISMRLGRKLTWDPERELFIGDDEANGWLSRKQRKGYEIKA